MEKAGHKKAGLAENGMHAVRDKSTEQWRSPKKGQRQRKKDRGSG